MSLTERIAVVIDASSGGAVREFNKATAASGKFTKETEQQHVQIGKLKVSHEQLAAGLRAGVATAALAGAYALGRFGKAAVAEAREAAKIGRLTEAVLESTGGVANVTADHVSDLATNLSNLAGVDDEVIQGGENLLLTFTNIRNEVGAGNDVFDQATTAALDMSVALGKDMTSSVTMLGKALNDPIKGITALSRAGVSFTEQQKEQITTLVESGKVLEAQKIVLGELTTEFGGAAEAAADPAERLSVAFGNFEEAVGTSLLPIIDGVTEGLIQIAEAGEFLADHPALKRLALSILAVGGALLVANKAMVTYKAIQGAQIIQVLTRAAAGHTAVATATAAEAAAAGTATVAVEGLATAEAAAGAASVGMLAKLGAVAAFIAKKPLFVGFDSLQEGDVGENVSKFLDDAKAKGLDLVKVMEDLDKAGFDAFANGGDLPIEKVNELREKYGLAADAADGLTGSEQKLTDAHEQSAKAAEEAAKKEQELLDARIASYNSAINYTRAELGVKDALVALHDAQDTGSHEEYRKAVLDAKDALLSEADAAVDLARDQREARGKTLDAGDAQKIYRDELSKLASDLAPGSRLRQYLRGLIHDLDDAGRNRHSTLTVSTFVSGADYAPGTHRRMASGGPVMGFGSSDSVRMLATPGEFVVRRDGSNLKDALAYYGGNRLVDGYANKAGGGPMVGQIVVNTTDRRVAESIPSRLREMAFVKGDRW